MVYVDGLAYYPRDDRRTRAGWGVFVGHSHPWNSVGHLPGDAQSSFKAEVVVVAHALAAIPGPLHIVSDCKAVAGLISNLLEGHAVNQEQDAELRSLFNAAIN